MTTDFTKNTIVTAGGITPASVDTPGDTRTRVETENDILNIPNPYVGMIVYVRDTDKYFKIKTLKEKEIGNTIIQNAAVDTYEEYDLSKYALQQEVIELRNIIQELTYVPEIVIANKNIESEMEYLNEKCKDENVIGIIIDPYITPATFKENSWHNYDLNFPITLINDDKVGHIKEATIKLKENDIYNAELNRYFMYDHYTGTSELWKEQPTKTYSWERFTSTSIGIHCLNKENTDSGFITLSGEKLNGIHAKDLLRQAYEKETELQIYLTLCIDIKPNEKQSYIKTIEIPYSTIVSFK